MTSAFVGLAAFVYVGAVVLVLRLMHNCPMDDEE